MQVAIGIGNVAIALKTWYVAQLKSGMDLATIAAGKLKTALMLVGVVAAVAAVVTEYVRLKGAVENSTTALSDFDTEVVAVSGAAAKLNPINTIWQKITYSILGAITAQKEFNGLPTVKTVDPRAGSNYAQGFRDRLARQAADAVLSTEISTGTATAGGGGIGQQIATVNSVLTAGTREASRTAKLLSAGVSEGLASLIVSTATTSKAFKKELAKVSTDEGLAKMQARFNKTAAGQQEIAAASAAAAQAAAQAAAEFAAAQAAAAAAEAAALAERERVYQSFADSVKNTFAGIKNSIMGAFDLTQLGGSTNAITRNMEKLLTRLRAFATNVKSLATMGLNPALLQQIISAGPMAGARLAEGLVMGGVGGLSAINAGYSEFGALSGQIAETGTQSLFGTGQQQTVYNINVDGGVGSGSTIGKAIVDAIKAYERTSGAVWQGA
jgi:hypothetical protein